MKKLVLSYFFLLFVFSTSLWGQYDKVVIVGASIMEFVYAKDINNPNSARTNQWNALGVDVDVYGYGFSGATINGIIPRVATAMAEHPSNTLFMIHIGGNNVTATKPYDSATPAQLQAISDDYDALFASIPPARMADVIIMPLTFRLYDYPDEDLVNNQELGSLPYNVDILIPKIAANAPAQMNIDGNPIVDLYHYTLQNFDTYFDFATSPFDEVHPSSQGEDDLSEFMCLRAAYFINGGAIPDPLTDNIAVTGVEISEDILNIETGDTVTLVGTVSPSNATNTTVEWTSSNVSVATVNNAGLVTTLIPGTTTITVTTEDGGFTDTVALNVSNDTDGDGILDVEEVNLGTDSNNPCDPAQAAGYTDYDAGNAIWAAADCDGDGVANGEEDTNGTDPYLVSGDSDGDGIDDDNEINNGTNQNDPCDPAQASGYTGYDAANAIWAAADCDGDGIANGNEDTNGTDPYLVSDDMDGDGIDDDDEINNGTNQNDPCDPAQAAGYTGYDAANAIWAAADCDGDGIANGNEDTNGTDPYLISDDMDGDGIDDDNEINDSTDPADPCDPMQPVGYTGYNAGNAIWVAADCDGDGVTNADEVTNGTDPYDSSALDDTDNDGVLDGNDSCPTIYNPAQEDFDNDGLGDACDNDIDNDGILNEDDLCQETLLGSIVDGNGCAILLEVDNFVIKTVGETCVDSRNGQIEITAKLFLNYVATLINSEGVEISSSAFNEYLLLGDLLPDKYTLCLTIAGNSTYKQCYLLNVLKVEPLDVNLDSSASENKIVLGLSGAKSYTVEFNDGIFTTTDNQVTLSLSEGENSIKVSTDKNCQGTYEKIVVLGSKGFIYPNPIGDKNLTIYVGPNGTDIVQLSVFNSTGSEVSVQKLISDENGYVNINVSSFSQGIYFLTVATKDALAHYKVIKK